MRSDVPAQKTAAVPFGAMRMLGTRSVAALHVYHAAPAGAAAAVLQLCTCDMRRLLVPPQQCCSFARVLCGACWCCCSSRQRTCYCMMLVCVFACGELSTEDTYTPESGVSRPCQGRGRSEGVEHNFAMWVYRTSVLPRSTQAAPTQSCVCGCLTITSVLCV